MRIARCHLCQTPSTFDVCGAVLFKYMVPLRGGGLERITPTDVVSFYLPSPDDF